MDGILSVYKPVGMSSYDVIREFKRLVKPSFKVGHGGTLDPFAEGVLLLLLGKATKRMNELALLPKTYVATAMLGATTDTLDLTGAITEFKQVKITKEQIEQATRRYIGEYEQEIPQYSAAKVEGVPRYQLARRGMDQAKKTKVVKIYNISQIRVEKSEQQTTAIFEAEVGAGTYIRQLSYDIFQSIGVESYLTKLVRTKIGDFSVAKCVKISDFENEVWRDMVVPL